MKSLILYYSQCVTGNTEKIAKKIAAGLRTGGNTCDLIKLTKYSRDLEIVRSTDFKAYDLIGIGVPVYYFHPPYHILDLLHEFPRLDGLRGFLFCTSGGNPGSTLYQMKVILDQKGLKIIDGYDRWIGHDVHQMYSRRGGHLESSDGHPTIEELEEAEKFGENLIKKAEDPSTPEKTDFWDKESSSAKMWTFEGIQKWFPEFNLVEERCTSCGKCAEICPVDAIVLDPYPRWVKDCDRCYICELKCPEGAIVCDWGPQCDYIEDLMAKRKARKGA
ncbi:MAG: EFR1 family ferrodoxin [Candidatus Syntropharchaeales archaeon]